MRNSPFELEPRSSGLEHLYKRKVYCDTTKEKLKLEIFIDRSSVKIFINDGIDTMTANVYPKQEANKIKFSANGTAEIITLKKWDINY